MATFIEDLKQAKLLGHPIHVMLIHFPMALFPVGFFFDLLSLIKDEKLFALIGFYCMGVGLAGAVIAGIFGVMDFLKLPDNETIRNKAVIHASINMLLICVYIGLFVFRLPYYENPKIISPGLTIVNGLLVISLLVSAHFGGELILKHKIGTIAEEKK